MFFAMETRAEVIEEFPSANFGEVAQILGEWWQDCSASEKRKYQRMHEKDKVRYAKECGGTYTPKTFKKAPAKRKRSTSKRPASAPAAKKVTSYFGALPTQICSEVFMHFGDGIYLFDVHHLVFVWTRYGQGIDQSS